MPSSLRRAVIVASSAAWLAACGGAAAPEDTPPNTGTSIVAAASGGEALAIYRQGVEALADAVWDQAFEKLEAAIIVEPDNLRYGADYRQGIILVGKNEPATYQRAISFFEDLVDKHPREPNAWLNLAFACVDKIPVEGAITQVVLASRAVEHFDQALALEESWLGFYSRGRALLFWPPIFGRTGDGIRDLERAVAISRGGDVFTYHASAWAALGDGHWRLDDVVAAREIWREGLAIYPNNVELEARLERVERSDLDAFLNAHYDTGRRVETHLREIFGLDSRRSHDAASQDGASQDTVARETASSEDVEPSAPEEPVPVSVRFEERGEPAGVRFVHSTRRFRGRYKHQVLEMFTESGAAVAVGDYNADGWDDLFITDSDEGKTHHLMRNNGPDSRPGKQHPAGPEPWFSTFSEVTTSAGVGGGNDRFSIVVDALWLDFDNDGHLDLYLGRFGTPILFRNGGPETGYRFTDVSLEVGLTRFANTIATIAFDADGDGWLDLMLANYFQPLNLLDLDTTKVLPNNFDYADNGGGVTFLRNLAHASGGRRFVDETERAGLAHHTGWSLDIGHADLDNDGDQDVYVAGDYGTDRLFMNDGANAGGAVTFSDVTEETLGFDTKKGMNVDMGDYDRNGFLDIYVTNITDEYMKECNMLWHNFGDGTFMDLAKESGTCDTDWGWAAKFGDFDNDGWEDLFVVNGLRSRNKESNYIPVLLETTITRDGVDLSDLGSYPNIEDMTWSGYQKQRFFSNLKDGTFKEIAAAAGVDNDFDGRGIGMGDFNNDGLLDLFQANVNQPSLLYFGATHPAGHWIELVLVGTRASRNAIGARVRVEAGGDSLLREVNGGNGYSSQSSFRLHFGLGEVTRVDSVEVRWPGPEARVETITSVPLDAISWIVEGEGVVRSDPPLQLNGC